MIKQNVSIMPVSSQNFAKRNPVKIFTENCEYEFQANGACTVEYIGPFRPGNTKGQLNMLNMFSYNILYVQIFVKISFLGSCFPKTEGFQGENCFGWPEECQNCFEL